MATFKEIAHKMAEMVISDGANNRVANEIVRRIETYTYSNDGTPLSVEDKFKIVELLQIELSNQEHYYKEADNKNFLQMISHIRNQLRSKGGK